MRLINHLLLSTLCVTSTHLFAQDKQDEIIAVWDTGERGIEIYKADERYVGNPINSEGERYPEIEILNLEYKKGKWIGKIYGRRRNRPLDVVCRVKEDKLLLKIQAGHISKELEWIRVK